MSAEVAPPVEQFVVPLFAQPDAVAELRHRVGRHLAACGLAGYAGTAELCVSELLTNVVVHVGAGTPVVLRVLVADGRPRIEVTDPDFRSLPAALHPPADAESGRGLALLDALSPRWGVSRHRDGKTVWCEVGEP